MSSDLGRTGRERVTAVVPVLNAARFLEACLGAVVRAMDQAEEVDVELVLVDNGSTDGSVELIRARWGDRARILELPSVNVGAVRNRGVREGTGEILVFIDADCVVAGDHFDRAARILRETGAAATGSSYALPERPAWVERTWHRLHEPRGAGPVKYLNAGNFVCRRAAFDAVGGFDESLTSGEDAELGMRLTKGGYTILEEPSLVAVHLGNPKSLRHFYRKQRWHGLGMLGTFWQHWRDLPLLATVAHLGALLAAVVLPAAYPGRASSWAAVPLLLALVPGLAVGFRGITGRRLPPIAGGIVLYFVYFTARLVALLLLLSRRASRSHRG